MITWAPFSLYQGPNAEARVDLPEPAVPTTKIAYTARRRIRWTFIYRGIGLISAVPLSSWKVSDIMDQTVFEIISVGNELLIGKVENTNAHWMISYVNRLGGLVRLALTIRDDLDAIASALRQALTRETEWTLISGGLGPTYDDMTLEGVARALGRKLELNQDALRMIRQRYEGLVKDGVLKEFELTPTRLKMAILPQGAVPLRNPAGTAPGVLLWEGRSNVVCLPGVSMEMKAIFEESLKPILEKRIIRLFPFGATLFVRGIVESSLSPLLDRVLEAHPWVYVKSHPKGVEDGLSKIEVHMVSHARGQTEAKSKTMAAARALVPLIEQKGGQVERVEEEPIQESVPGEGP